MLDNFILVHIVGQQTLPNLIPLLAFRPKKVIQIISNDTKMKKAAENIKKAAAESLLPIEWEDLFLDQQSPLPTDIINLLSSKVNQNWIANITGGTKLMSIGLMQVAQINKVPAFYCDSENLRILQIGIEPLPPYTELINLQKEISVPFILAANGVSNTWTDEKITRQHCEFGKLAFEQWNLMGAELKGLADNLRSHFKKNNNVKKVSELRLLVNHEFNPIGYASEYLGLGANLLQFFNKTENGWVINASDKLSKEKLPRRVEKIINTMEGGWWELTVLNWMFESNNYTDIRWSVEPPSDDRSFGETDILAVDKKTLKLTVISCKSGDVKQEHIESHKQRSEGLGGSQVRKVLALYDYEKLDDAKRKTIEKCNMEIITKKDLL